MRQMNDRSCGALRRVGAAAGFFLAVCGAAAAPGQDATFPYGVASGDVSESGAVLWTHAAGAAAVDVEVSEAESFASLAAVTIATARSHAGAAAADPSVVFLVSGLVDDRPYFYRFVANGSDGVPVVSPIGRFRTLPRADQPAALRFAFSGDSNFAYAPFGLLSSVAREDAAFFLWFGDTMYADVTAGGLGRARTLAEYRAKYQQVRGDANVQAVSAAMSALVGWDDHEIRNDYAGTDPELPPEQRDAAYQAFFEYMPIAEVGGAANPFQTYRRIAFGAEVEFYLLDGRQYRERSALEVCGGHPDPTGYIAGTVLSDAECAAELSAPRTMLGAEQLGWLLDGLLASTAKVKFVVTSVPLQFLGIFPYDRWDGYDAERRVILEFIANNAIDGVFFLTTDFHGNFYNPDVMAYFRRYRPDYALAPGTVAPELIVGPIGQETFQHTLDELRAALVDLVGNPAVADLLDVLESNVYSQLRKVSGVSFVEPDKLAYALIDVSRDGIVSITLKGAAPGAYASGTTPPAEVFYQTTAEQDSPAPGLLPCCAGPVLACVAVSGVWCVSRRTVERKSAGRDA